MIEKNFLKRIITSFVLISILFSMFISSMMMILIIIIISALSFYEFNRLFVRILDNIFLKILSSGLILLYLFSFIFIIFWIESVKFENAYYKLFFFYSIFVSILSDIGGYIIGNIFKGKKLTKISPNKTISGAIGALIFSILIIPIFYKYLGIDIAYVSEQQVLDDLYLLGKEQVHFYTCQSTGATFVGMEGVKARVQLQGGCGGCGGWLVEWPQRLAVETNQRRPATSSFCTPQSLSSLLRYGYSIQPASTTSIDLRGGPILCSTH